MKYAKLDTNKIVIQIQPNKETGFIEVDDSVVCGMIQNADLTFRNPVKSDTEIAIEQLTAISNSIQNHLDTKAQEFRYNNMMSARSYTGYTNAFQTEAQSLATWASKCWVVAGQIEADVQSGVRVMPTVDEVLAELPVYV